MKYIIIAAIFITILIGIGFSDHDQKVIESSQRYEQCVQREFGMTVYQVIEATGEQPVCK